MSVLIDQPIVFVYGALRSGTTVFRLMLDHHPEISNPGELDFLFDYLSEDPSHPTGWRYDLEAMKLDRIFVYRNLDIPEGLTGVDLLADFLRQIGLRYGQKHVMTINIHRNVDRAALLLPNAKFIHMLRDPRDVANSSRGMGWAASLFYGVEHWIKTEQSWDRGSGSIPATHQMVLTFENLFYSLEAELRRVCAFLGVAFDTLMLDYHLNSTYAPPDAKLVEQWKRKGDAHQIALLEGKAGALMRQRGYEPTGQGIVPGWGEKLLLAAEHKRFRWAFAIRRYGVWLFLAEKLSARLKIDPWHSSTRQRINAINQSYVK